MLNWRSRAVKMQGKITVDGREVCEAIVMCMVVPRVRKAVAAAAPAGAPGSGLELPE